MVVGRRPILTNIIVGHLGASQPRVNKPPGIYNEDELETGYSQARVMCFLASRDGGGK